MTHQHPNNNKVNKAHHSDEKSFHPDEDWKSWFELDSSYIASREYSKKQYINNHMNSQLPQKTPNAFMVWLKTYKIPVIFAFSLILVLILSLVLVDYFARTPDQSSNVAQNKDETTQKNDTDSKTDSRLATAAEPRIIDLELLTFDKDQPEQVRAQNRIELLTNGTSLSQIMALQNQPSGSESGGAPASSSPSLQFSNTVSEPSQQNTINSDQASQLVRQNQINDLNIWYTESVIQNLDGNSSDRSNSTGFNPSKPYTIQSWSTANFNKFILTQDGTIFEYYVSTPEFFLNFKGGSYAFKQIFSEPRYFSGIGFTIESYQNFELEFFKSMVENSEYVRVEDIERDGKVYAVYEDTLESVEGSPVTRYFVDSDTFRIAYTDNIRYGVVESTQKHVLATSQTVTSLDDVFSGEELSNVEIREFREPPYLSNEETLSKVAQQYTVLYETNIETKPYTIYTYDEYAWAELYNLSFSPEFDPSIDKDEPKVSQEGLSVNYLTDDKLNTSYRIFNTKEEADNYIDFTQPNTGYETIQQVDALVTINGQEVPTQASRTEYNNGTTQYTYGMIITFEYNGKYYVLNGTIAPNGTYKLNFDFVILDAQKASEIGKEMDLYFESQVQVEPIASINQVPRETRMVSNQILDLPLDLNFINRSRRSPQESKCSDYIYTIYELVYCTMEKHNGTEYHYATSHLANQDEWFGSIQVYILDAPLSDVKIIEGCRVLTSENCVEITGPNGLKGISTNYSNNPLGVTPNDLSLPSSDGNIQDQYWIQEVNGKIVIYRINEASNRLQPQAQTLISTLTTEFDEKRVDEMLQRFNYPYM